jgi:hypothetical protein
LGEELAWDVGQSETGFGVEEGNFFDDQFKAFFLGRA